MKSPIRLDVGCSGVVVHCRACGHWAAFRFTKDEAWEAAIAHEERVHPTRRDHRDAADVRAHRTRHAG